MSRLGVVFDSIASEELSEHFQASSLSLRINLNLERQATHLMFHKEVACLHKFQEKECHFLPLEVLVLLHPNQSGLLHIFRNFLRREAQHHPRLVPNLYLQSNEPQHLIFQMLFVLTASFQCRSQVRRL